MKNTFIVLFAAVLLMQACRKESKVIDAENKKLQGTWVVKSAKYYAPDKEKGEDALSKYKFKLLFFNTNQVQQQFIDTNLTFTGTYYLGKTTLNMHFLNPNGNVDHSVLLIQLYITKKEITASDYEPEGTYSLVFKKVNN